MSKLHKLAGLTVVVGLLAGFYGCKERTTAEKAGDTVEKGVQKVQDSASSTAKKGSDTLDDLSENVKK